MRLPAGSEFTARPNLDGDPRMATCTHLDRVKILNLPDSVAGCEDCLREGGSGCICGSAWAAVTSAAATTRRTATPPPPTQPIIR